MNKVILVGQLNNTNEVKMTNNNLEILDIMIEGIKAKVFGELVTKVKNMHGLVYAEGSLKLRDYTNKEGKTFPIQDIAINKIDSLEQGKEDIKEETTKWESAKEIVIDPDELPFY